MNEKRTIDEKLVWSCKESTTIRVVDVNSNAEIAVNESASYMQTRKSFSYLLRLKHLQQTWQVM